MTLKEKQKNWEFSIDKVAMEPCDVAEDPLGYRAVFFLGYEAAKQERRKSFSIGASYLEARQKNLSQAGFRTPMTDQALSMLEGLVGSSERVLEPA